MVLIRAHAHMHMHLHLHLHLHLNLYVHLQLHLHACTCAGRRLSLRRHSEAAATRCMVSDWPPIHCEAHSHCVHPACPLHACAPHATCTHAHAHAYVTCYVHAHACAVRVQRVYTCLHTCVHTFVCTAGDVRPRSLPRTVRGLRQLSLHFGEPYAPTARSNPPSLAASIARWRWWHHPPPQRPTRLLRAALWAREGSFASRPGRQRRLQLRSGPAHAR